MATPAIITDFALLPRPAGVPPDYCLYALHPYAGALFGGGWLNGATSGPSNPDGVGLDRIYVSASATLDAFAQVSWTNGQSPGTWDRANGQGTLYNVIANTNGGSYSLQAYYSPGQPIGGSSDIYYQVNDPDIVGSGPGLVMFMTAVPCQNEYPGRADGNGNPNFQVGWSTIGYATSSNGGVTWTWRGTLPQLNASGTPLLAPATTVFPANPNAAFNVFASGNAYPSAMFNDAGGLDLWYTHFNDATPLPSGTPLLTLSVEDKQGVWNAPQTCRLVTSAGTAALYVVNADVAHADDGSGTFWMVAQQWGGPESGDLKLFYSATSDGAGQGVNWHPWDGADGVLVVATNPAMAGLYDLLTPTIASAGNGTLDIYYSAPTSISANALPMNEAHINETFVLPGLASTLPAAPLFQIYDATVGSGGTAAGTIAAGEASYLSGAYFCDDPNNTVVAATTPSVWIVGGPGNDAIVAQSGSNILDGGAGSNFLVGGTGTDTFFLDARGGGTIWDSVENFHKGDLLTIWGWSAGLTTFSWTANDGYPGYTGETLHASLKGDGSVNASVTFIGAASNSFLLFQGGSGAASYAAIYNPG